MPLPLPLLPSPGTDWTDKASSAPAGGYGSVAETVIPGAFTIIGTLSPDAFFVPVIAEGGFSAEYFSMAFFSSPYFAQEGVPEDGAFEIRDDLTGTGARIVVAGSIARIQ